MDANRKIERSALVIGLDYPYSWSVRLRGARRDARAMARFLAKQGYKIELHCDGIFKRLTPQKILSLLEKYTRREDLGDFFFYFSGHGLSVPTTNPQEIDGRDEALLCNRPFGSHRHEILLDDDLHHTVSRFDRGVRVSVLVDACHSGTICDLALVRIGAGIVRVHGPTKKPVVTSIGSARDDEPAMEYESRGVLTKSFLTHARAGHRKPLELARRMNEDMQGCGITFQQCILSASIEEGFHANFF